MKRAEAAEKEAKRKKAEKDGDGGGDDDDDLSDEEEVPEENPEMYRGEEAELAAMSMGEKIEHRMRGISRGAGDQAALLGGRSFKSGRDRGRSRGMSRA